ncbi:CBO0543 family protein [Anaerobacillus sp. MEB173]|uniref:CBO0543 family protein n=1 Tax=Anaerobacillus sp. MEB173 TaxID=3383345 RepID=UPI003F926E42
MFYTFEKKVLNRLVALCIIIIPLTMAGRNYRKWMLSFLLNSYSNIFVAPFLAKKGYLKYPVRLLPSIYKSSIIYDYIFCSLFSTWFYRATYQDHWKTILRKAWLFILPQVLTEIWMERNTNLIRYRNGWTWFHSLITITFAKYFFRLILYIMDQNDRQKAN